MFSIAFKNGIIMILIILIVHFLLKNYLIDHRIAGFTQEPMPAPVPVPTPMEVKVPAPPSKVIEDDPVPSKNAPATAGKTVRFADDDNELLAYVKSLDEDPTVPINCDTKLDPSSVIKSSLKKSKPIHDPSNASGSLYYVSEYEEEDVMNGGMLFENINGFDNEAKSYGELC